jgi:hypothetical protein
VRSIGVQARLDGVDGGAEYGGPQSVLMRCEQRGHLREVVSAVAQTPRDRPWHLVEASRVAGTLVLQRVQLRDERLGALQEVLERVEDLLDAASSVCGYVTSTQGVASTMDSSARPVTVTITPPPPSVGKA